MNRKRTDRADPGHGGRTIERFIIGPLFVAILLTGIWKVAQDFRIGFVLKVLFVISGPATVASIRCMFVLPHHAIVLVVVYFMSSLCWVAFLSLPFWSRFRIGSLSALGTEIIIVVVAVVITFLCFAFMFATFPRPA